MRSLRIIVVNTVMPPEGGQDENAWMQAERARALRIGLLEAGYNIIAVFPVDMHLPDRVAQLQPDMIIIDAESDSRDVLVHVVVATRDAPRLIVLFTEDHATSSMEAAMAAVCLLMWWPVCNRSASSRYWMWRFIVFGWVHETQLLALQSSLRPMMRKFAYASCTLFGRDKVGVLFRAADDYAAPPELTAQIEKNSASPVRRYCATTIPSAAIRVAF